MEAEYAQILAKLRARREKLTKELDDVEGLIAKVEETAGIKGTDAGQKRRGRKSAFVPAVLELLLRDGGQVLTTQQIVDELAASGYQMETDDPYRNVAALLRRESRRSDGRITKIGENQWMASHLPEE